MPTGSTFINMKNWTEKELIAAEDYYTGCDHDLSEDRWNHVSEMMFDAGYPGRTPNAYRQKLSKVWIER